MKIDLCIPAYNEAPIIAHSVSTIRSALPQLPGVSWRLMVVDNASSDGTGDIVRELTLPECEVLFVSKKGKGAAIHAAALASKADLFGYIDADLSASPACLAQLLHAILAGNDIAVGSRLMRGATVSRTGLRTFSSEVFNYLRSVLVGVQVEDVSCGLKLTNAEGRDVLRLCQETGWFLDMEWLSLSQKRGLRIVEVPIEWVEQFYPDRKSKLSVVRDGLKALVAFVRIRRRISQ